jgi:hypothetical protein
MMDVSFVSSVLLVIARVATCVTSIVTVSAIVIHSLRSGFIASIIAQTLIAFGMLPVVFIQGVEVRPDHHHHPLREVCDELPVIGRSEAPVVNVVLRRALFSELVNHRVAAELIPRETARALKADSRFLINVAFNPRDFNLVGRPGMHQS